MDEHHWKFKVGSGAVDQYRAVRGQGHNYARVEVREGATADWDIWTGQPVAEEILRLATCVEELERKLDFHMREAADSKVRYHALLADHRRLQNEAVEASHDLSVKMELAEARVRGLEGQIARMVVRDSDLLATIGELRTEVAAKEATIHMAVARLGGMVEGAPTHRINFLQRIDELRRIEDAFDKMTYSD